MTAEAKARAEIDRLLKTAGRHVYEYKSANIHAARVVRETPIALDAAGLSFRRSANRASCVADDLSNICCMPSSVCTFTQ